MTGRMKELYMRNHINGADLDRWLTTPPDDNYYGNSTAGADQGLDIDSEEDALEDWGEDSDHWSEEEESQCSGFGCVDSCADCAPAQRVDLIAEAARLLERLEAAQLDIYYANADYDTPAGGPLPAGAAQRLDRLAAIRERARLRMERRDLADLPF